MKTVKRIRKRNKSKLSKRMRMSSKSKRIRSKHIRSKHMRNKSKRIRSKHMRNKKRTRKIMVGGGDFNIEDEAEKIEELLVEGEELLGKLKDSNYTIDEEDKKLYNLISDTYKKGYREKMEELRKIQRETLNVDTRRIETNKLYEKYKRIIKLGGLHSQLEEPIENMIKNRKLHNRNNRAFKKEKKEDTPLVLLKNPYYGVGLPPVSEEDTILGEKDPSLTEFVTEQVESNLEEHTEGYPGQGEGDTEQEVDSNLQKDTEEEDPEEEK